MSHGAGLVVGSERSPTAARQREMGTSSGGYGVWQGQGRFAHVVGVEAELVAEEREVVHVPRAQDDGVDVPRRAVREGGGDRSSTWGCGDGWPETLCRQFADCSPAWSSTSSAGAEDSGERSNS